MFDLAEPEVGGVDAHTQTNVGWIKVLKSSQTDTLDSQHCICVFL